MVDARDREGGERGEGRGRVFFSDTTSRGRVLISVFWVNGREMQLS